MAFSRENYHNEVQEIHKRRAHLKASHMINTDFNKEHPDECRDARQDPSNYTKLNARLKLEAQKFDKKVQDRRTKLGNRLS